MGRELFGKNLSLFGDYIKKSKRKESEVLNLTIAKQGVRDLKEWEENYGFNDDDED